MSICNRDILTCHLYSGRKVVFYASAEHKKKVTLLLLALKIKISQCTRDEKSLNCFYACELRIRFEIASFYSTEKIIILRAVYRYQYNV